jgi:hypothetical protein
MQFKLRRGPKPALFFFGWRRLLGEEQRLRQESLRFFPFVHQGQNDGSHLAKKKLSVVLSFG